MNCELGLAGVGAGQVLRSAGVHAGVVGAGVEDDEGIFRVVVHECVVAALREKHVILQQTSQSPSQSINAANAIFSLAVVIKTKKYLIS